MSDKVKSLSGEKSILATTYHSARYYKANKLDYFKVSDFFNSSVLLTDYLNDEFTRLLHHLHKHQLLW